MTSPVKILHVPSVAHRREGTLPMKFVGERIASRDQDTASELEAKRAISFVRFKYAIPIWLDDETAMLLSNPTSSAEASIVVTDQLFPLRAS